MLLSGVGGGGSEGGGTLAFEAGDHNSPRQVSGIAQRLTVANQENTNRFPHKVFLFIIHLRKNTWSKLENRTTKHTFELALLTIKLQNFNNYIYSSLLQK